QEHGGVAPPPGPRHSCLPTHRTILAPGSDIRLPHSAEPGDLDDAGFETRRAAHGAPQPAECRAERRGGMVCESLASGRAGAADAYASARGGMRLAHHSPAPRPSSGLERHSHSIVPGGFDVTSSTTRLTFGT